LGRFALFKRRQHGGRFVELKIGGGRKACLRRWNGFRDLAIRWPEPAKAEAGFRAHSLPARSLSWLLHVVHSVDGQSSCRTLLLVAAHVAVQRTSAKLRRQDDQSANLGLIESMRLHVGDATARSGRRAPCPNICRERKNRRPKPPVESYGV
jgi:hypothetical protein